MRCGCSTRLAGTLRKIRSVPTMNHDTLLVIFVGLTGLALVVEAVVIVAAFFFARKTVKKLHADVDELRAKAMPLLSKSHDLMEKVSPRIDSISRDMADLSRRAREQGEGFSDAASDILGRVNRQTSRVDSMFTSMFDSIEHAGNVVADSVSKPVRHANGALAAIKAFLNVMTSGSPASEADRQERVARVSTDQDMFV